jgi:hypothetical protein
MSAGICAPGEIAPINRHTSPPFKFWNLKYSISNPAEGGPAPGRPPKFTTLALRERVPRSASGRVRGVCCSGGVPTAGFPPFACCLPPTVFRCSHRRIRFCRGGLCPPDGRGKTGSPEDSPTIPHGTHRTWRDIRAIRGAARSLAPHSPDIRLSGYISAC